MTRFVTFLENVRVPIGFWCTFCRWFQIRPAKFKILKKIDRTARLKIITLVLFFTILVSIIETVVDLAKKLVWYERPIYCRPADTSNCFVAPLVGSELGLESVDPQPLVLRLVHRWQQCRALTPVVFAVPVALLLESMIGILATSGEKHRILSFACSLQPTWTICCYFCRTTLFIERVTPDRSPDTTGDGTSSTRRAPSTFDFVLSMQRP